MSILKCISFNCRVRQHGIIFYAFIAFFITSCSGLKLKPDPSNPVRRIAVLPLYNKTAQKNAKPHVRKELLKRLEMLYYEVLPLEKTDEILTQNGLSTEGIDFKGPDLERLKKAFDVEGLFFGTLLNYDFYQKGPLNVKMVAGQFWFVDLTKKDEVWHSSLGVRSESLLENGSPRAEMSMNDMNWDQAPEMMPVPPEDLPSGNMDMNFFENFDQGAKQAVFEEVSNEMPEWVNSDFCSETPGARFFEEDIKGKLACEVGELIERAIWTFPVGPGGFEK